MERIKNLVKMADAIKAALFDASQKMESGPGRVAVLQAYNQAAGLAYQLSKIIERTPESWARAMEEKPDPFRPL